VLNHLPGRTVRQRLSLGPLPVGAACRVFADAAAGLHAAHAAGVVHRDLKPGNVMVGPTGRGTVIDFGLALMAGERGTDWRLVGGPRVTVGTLDYMPPEQAADAARVTPAADLYALGGSLFTALTGRLPFEAAGVTAKLAALRTLPPPAVAEFRPDVPKPLADFITRLLAKRPEERPASAAEAATELERWADRAAGDPVPDRPPLAAVIAEAEAEWSGRVGPSDTDQATAMVAVPTAPPAVVLSRRRAWGLAAGVGAATAAAALLGYALAGG
jgi:serine/threonine-protein kinase